MNLSIDKDAIENSFDRIATELLNSKTLDVNGQVFRFTEIEFYYFHKDYHPDEYTHRHLRKAGEWRFHNQGIDITLEGNDVQDGGILIRGILVDGQYINGPIKCLKRIFEAFGKVTEPTSFILKDGTARSIPIIKTIRHLPNSVAHPDFQYKLYRYLVEFEKLEIEAPMRLNIQAKHLRVA